MQCPKCQAEIAGQINFCSVCGYRLKRPSNFFNIPLRILILILFMVILGYLVGYRSAIRSNKASAPGYPSPFTDKSSDDPSIIGIPPDENETPPADQEVFVQLPHGKIILRDIIGNILMEYPVVAVSGGWVAFPVKFAYGAYKWEFVSAAGTAIPVQGGFLLDHDPIGLWRIDDTLKLSGPELWPFSPDLPLEWIPINSNIANIAPVEIQPADYIDSGSFAQIKIPESIRPYAGCFIQRNRVVGWTFGSIFADGFLWVGHMGNELIPDFRVDDFYRLTFAQTREESYVKALYSKPDSDEDFLELLTEGFEYESKIPEDDIPEPFRTEKMAQTLLEVVQRLILSGQHQIVANYLDANVLLQALNVELALHVIDSVFKSEGAGAALPLIGQLNTHGPSSWFDAGGALSKWYRKLYIKRLEEVSDSGPQAEVFDLLKEARSLFPDDPAIHLTAVRMYLNEGNWQTAETLILERKYPETYKDTIEALSNRIALLKGREGSVVIEFNPGAIKIPVNVRLNERVSRKFIIDTGASVTTIPPSAAEAIGVDVDRLTVKRRFFGAGGEYMAPVIKLESLAIDHLVIYDLSVLIVELPHDGQLGLLGMDFLSRFKMDLNSDAGILILEPK